MTVPALARSATEWRAFLTGCLVSIAVTGWWLWPALGRGQLLYRDFVQVPDPALGPATLGLTGSAPRAVPLDAVTALLAPVVPTGVQQQVLLVASLLAGGCGVAFLVRRHGAAAAGTAAAVASWSAYAAERLLVGQPPTLLGVAMVPWLVAAARTSSSCSRRVLLVVLAALPAALTPFGGLLAVVVVLLAARTGRDRAVLAVVGVCWCLPFVVAAVLGSTGAGDGTGAAAFAVRAAGVGGVLDVLTGAGIWSTAATPASRADPSALLAGSLLLAGAVICLAARLPRWQQPGGRQDRGLLALAALGPPLVALLLASAPAAPLWARAQSIPGLAVLRDTHRLLGLSVLAVAVLLGLGVGAVQRHLATTPRVAGAAGAVAAAGLATLVAAAAIVSVPDAPARLHQAYRSGSYPADWDRAVAAVGERATLVLPWQPLRSTAALGTQPFLDPLPLALPGRVVSAHALRVERDGRTLTVGAAEEPPDGGAWAAGELDVAALRESGIEAVVVWRHTPGLLPTGLREDLAVGDHPLPGLTVTATSSLLAVLTLDAV